MTDLRAVPTDPTTEPSAVARVAEESSGRHAAGRRVVVGVDGSTSSLLALRWALDEADLRQLPVHVVLSWAMPAVVGMSPVMLPSEFSVESGARSELDEILKEHAESVGGRSARSPITSAVMAGSASLVLLEAAADADLLVLGSRGHGGFAGLLLGSVSQQCAAHARCPVVIVHGEDTRHLPTHRKCHCLAGI